MTRAVLRGERRSPGRSKFQFTTRSTAVRVQKENSWALRGGVLLKRTWSDTLARKNIWCSLSCRVWYKCPASSPRPLGEMESLSSFPSSHTLSTWCFFCIYRFSLSGGYQFLVRALFQPAPNWSNATPIALHHRCAPPSKKTAIDLALILLRFFRTIKESGSFSGLFNWSVG